MQTFDDIPYKVSEYIVELSVGWRNRLKYKRVNHEYGAPSRFGIRRFRGHYFDERMDIRSVTFDLDWSTEPGICHAFIAITYASKAWHRAVLGLMERWHLTRLQTNEQGELEFMQFSPRIFKIAGTLERLWISTQRDEQQDWRRIIFESYIKVKPEEFTGKPQLWNFNPETWFCEWEECTRIVGYGKGWNTEKDITCLGVDPHDQNMWQAEALMGDRRTYLWWKRKGKEEVPANERYERSLRKNIREQEGREEFDRQMGANWARFKFLRHYLGNQPSPTMVD